MVSRQLLAPEHRDAVDAEVVASFFREEIGRRLLAADKVYREVPFSYGLPAEEAYPGAGQSIRGETVLVQGIIDCLFEESGGLVLLDYKTDAVYGDRLDMLKERYGVQLGLYAKAIEHIWRRPVKEKVLYFFDGPHFVRLGER
jgi:ATP-dependent helicase/nuclease subunit A